MSYRIFTVEQVAQRTEVPEKALHWAISQGLVPQFAWTPKYNAWLEPPVVDEVTAVLLVVAVRLWGLGLGAEQIKSLLAGICRVGGGQGGRMTVPLLTEVAAGRSVVVQWAPEGHLLLRVSGRTYGWYRLCRSGVEPDDYFHPDAVLSADLGAIHAMLLEG